MRNKTLIYPEKLKEMSINHKYMKIVRKFITIKKSNLSCHHPKVHNK